MLKVKKYQYRLTTMLRTIVINSNNKKWEKKMGYGFM